MGGIDKSLNILDAVANGGKSRLKVDSRALLLTTIIYLGIMLSVATSHVDILLWFALYPIVASPTLGLTYLKVFLQSLIVLPLVILLGVFNPIIDKTPVASLDGLVITQGWLLFIGIILRGLLSMQALLLLINSIGFTGIVSAMSRLGVPKFIVVQLLMVFRYIRVLIEEGAAMKRARDARSFGRKNLSIKMWGILIGQLFLRSMGRAERIHKAMLARGFDGEMPVNFSSRTKWNMTSSVYLIMWTILFVFLRLFNLSLLFVE